MSRRPLAGSWPAELGLAMAALPRNTPDSFLRDRVEAAVAVIIADRELEAIWRLGGLDVVELLFRVRGFLGQQDYRRARGSRHALSDEEALQVVLGHRGDS